MRIRACGYEGMTNVNLMDILIIMYVAKLLFPSISLLGSGEPNQNCHGLKKKRSENLVKFA